jgi:hypothetical protein
METNPDPHAQIGNQDLPSPVSRLPPELLAKIFEHLVTCSSPVILLRVCHLWADIASSISSLWAIIDFSTPPTSFLQRSLDRPIEVNLLSSPAAPEPEQLWAAKRLLSLQKDRVRKLVLDLPVDHLRKMGPDLSVTFPILAEVSISTLHNDHRTLHIFDFPTWVPASTPPPIRYLKLLLVKTPWVPGRFQNLVEFFLHDQWYADLDPPMEIFLEILESSPLLAVLSVANAGPRLPLDTTVLPPATRIVHLRKLQQLYLEQEDPCDIGWVLIHLNIPISTNVKIFVDIRPDNQTPVPLGLVFGLILPNHFGFPHLTNVRRCTYAVDLGPSCIITAPNFVLRLVWDNNGYGHFEYFLLPFLGRVSASGVIENLSVITDLHRRSSICEPQWEQIFDTLSSLRKLRVEQSQHNLDLSIQGLLQSRPCPALRDLELSSVVFSGEGMEKMVDGEVVAGRFVDYFAERDRRGYRLERLVIEAPIRAPPDLASLLAPHVDYVEIREDLSGDEDVWALEFGSRRIFDSLRACRYDEC